MARAPKDQDGEEAEDKDAMHVRFRFSREGWEMLNEMAAARGGGAGARYTVLEEAVRLWYDQDPLMARKRRKTKSAPAPEGGAA